MRSELERQNAVNRFKKMDAGIGQDLDNLVNLIAQICEVPVALVSLIDADMQWFKASIGTGDIDCNRRDQSFCQFTIMQNDLLIIPDAALDERTATLPIVNNNPNARFYAGVPLITFDGHAIGTLCILDVVPRQLTAVQKSTLQLLGKQVLNLIELNWSLEMLSHQQQQTEQQKQAVEDSELKLRAIFDSSKDMHVLANRNMQILAYNKVTAEYIQKYYQRKLRPGESLHDTIHDGIRNEFVACFNKALNGKNVKTVWKVNPGGSDVYWHEVTFAPVTDKDGTLIGVAFNAADITQQKASEDHIEQQNLALERIATMQSHELRRPVASIMGLMEVIKLDNYTVADYFQMLELTVNELDGVIRGIVRESEVTISTRN
jgi:PAS domain S-box-containing protein